MRFNLPLPSVYSFWRNLFTSRIFASESVLGKQRIFNNIGRNRGVVHAVRELREKIRKEILAWERAGTVRHSTEHELNRLMADYPMRTRLQGSEKGLVMRLYFVARQPEDLLAPLAYGAATLFSSVDRTRVRKCDQSVLHFHDTSKKGTRRWCSMRLCGNRLKVAAYAARKREGQQHSTAQVARMAASKIAGH